MDKVSKYGYKKGSPYEDRSFNHIKSNKISMKDVDKSLMLIPVGQRGQGTPVLAKPGEEHYFPDYNSVLEIPVDPQIMKQGGSSKFKTSSPTNSKLYHQIVKQARKKFKVWPSGIAKAWVEAEYKQKGGRFDTDFSYRYEQGGENSQDFINFEKTSTMKKGRFGNVFQPVMQVGGNLTLNSDMLPEIESWEPGQTYPVMMNVKQLTPGKKGKAKFQIIDTRYMPQEPEYMQAGGPTGGFSSQMTTSGQKQNYPMYGQRNVGGKNYFYKGSSRMTPEEFSRTNRNSAVPGIPQLITEEEYAQAVEQTPYNVVYGHSGDVQTSPSQLYFPTVTKQYGGEGYDMPEENLVEFKKGGSTKNWIPKNLKKGRCTPAPNPDCPVGSPQFNLAMTFKKHKGFHKKQDGGEAPFGQTSQEYLENRNSNFMDIIRNQTLSAINEQETNDISQQLKNFMQFGGEPEYDFTQQYSQQGPITEEQGSNPSFYTNEDLYNRNSNLHGYTNTQILNQGNKQIVDQSNFNKKRGVDDYSDYEDVVESPYRKRSKFFAGPALADTLLLGANLVGSAFEQAQNKKEEEKLRMQRIGDNVFQAAPASQGSRGDYDVNSGMFRPDQMVPTQFKGYAKKGGECMGYGGEYKEGGEYNLTDEQITRLLRSGGQIEYI